ncbi:PREDICTED: uncharacterized protein C10orf12 [Crocodylus porosus]|nr:PREDICTED: uncharacterized protein C10orf12 [Crocodylus porosus]
MVRLCTHHQKQFIRVLNDIYTEVQPGLDGQPGPAPDGMDASTCSSGCSQLRSPDAAEKGAACPESKPPSSSDAPQDPPSHLHGAGHADRTETSAAASKRDCSEQPSSASPKESPAHGYLTTSNSSSLHFHPAAKGLEGPPVGHEPEPGAWRGEDKDPLPGKALGWAASVNGSEDSLEGCLVSPRNSSFRAFPEEAWDPGFSARRADKENALQCGSKASLHPDLEPGEHDARPKPDHHLHGGGKAKAGYHLHPGDKPPLESTRDAWLPTSKASHGHARAKAPPASIKTSRKSKRASGLRINDYDNQCDVVYISQPITECRFESQRAAAPRKTARKSTRGYYFNGECCELPTVRTLAKSARAAEDRGGSTALRADALASAKQPAAAAGKDGDKRVSLRLLAKGTLPGRETKERADESEPRETHTLKGREVASAEPAPVPPAVPGSECAETPSSPLLANGTSPAPSCEEETWQAPIGGDGDAPSPASAGSCGDVGSEVASSSMAGVSALLPVSVAARSEAGSPCSEAQATAEPPVSGDPEPPPPLPASAQPASPSSTDPEPPARGDVGPSTELPPEPPAAADQELPAEPPASPAAEPPEAPAASGGCESPVQPAASPAPERSPSPPPGAGSEGDAAALEAAVPGAPGEAEPGPADLGESPEGEPAPGESQPGKDTIPTPPSPEASGADVREPVSPCESSDKKRKKSRRALVASDRCLRSQHAAPGPEGSAEAPGSLAPLQLPCLQIKLSKSPGAKRFKREVHLAGAAPVHFPNDCFHPALLEGTEMAAELPAGKESGVTTRQTYRSLLAKEAAAAEGQGPPGKGASPAPGSPGVSGDMLEICVEASSDKRSVLLPKESGPGAEAEAKQPAAEPREAAADAGQDPETSDAGKGQLGDLASASPAGPGSRGGSKHAPSKPTKLRRQAPPSYNLRHTPVPSEVAKKSAPGKEAVQASPSPPRAASGARAEELLEGDAPGDGKPRFVEWCSEEENQELIAEFNTHYLKVQKGWIQLEREVQPAPKAKNRADKLKEIWKSKKRTRKSRGPLEGQKLSPVQMLFMKAFQLSDICRWFLETTETRSLVIVKKLNTRLPGEVPTIKPPLQKFPMPGPYPSSLQAERLKKHLKKFPATTPARNNPKNQKLLAKLRESTDRTEAAADASPAPAPPAEARCDAASEPRSTPPAPSLPTQASTRILRKYSQLRGKLRAQHRALKPEKKGDGAPEPPVLEGKSRKSVCINPLMSPKLALQVKADAFPKPAPAYRALKGRKAKGQPADDTPAKADPQLGRKKKPPSEGSGAQERPGSSGRDRLPAKKASKAKHVEMPAKAPSTRKQAAAERSNKLEKKGLPKEKRALKRPLAKSRLSAHKGKENTSRRAAPAPGHEGLARSPKQLPAGEPSTRSQKGSSKKPSGGKTLTRAMKKSQEGAGSQGKRKLRAKGDCSQSKRTRLDTK